MEGDEVFGDGWARDAIGVVGGVDEGVVAVPGVPGEADKDG